METIIIKAEGASLSKVKSFLKEMQIPFKIKKTKKEKGYDPKFVKMVLKASKEQGGIILTEEYKKNLFQDL